MILKSTVKLTNSYNINEVYDDMCTVTVINLESEKIVEVEGNVDYEYEAYDMTLIHNEKYIANHVDTLIEKGRARENSHLADVSIEDRLEAIEEAILELALGE